MLALTAKAGVCMPPGCRTGIVSGMDEGGAKGGPPGKGGGARNGPVPGNENPGFPLVVGAFGCGFQSLDPSLGGDEPLLGIMFVARFLC